MSDGTGAAAASPLRDRQRNRPRSRVDRFALLVEQTGPGRHHHRPTDDDRDLLALVEIAHHLGRVQQPTVREQFRQDLADRLRAEFAQQRTAALPSVPAARTAPGARAVAGGPDLADVETQLVRQVRPRRSHGRLAVVIGLATGALALSGVSAASGGALPGDPLYSVKRSGEQAQLMLAGSDASRGRLHLDFAHTRLVEARQVGPDAIGPMLAEMDHEVTEAARLLFSAAVESGDVGLIDSVAAFVARHRADLLDLRTATPLPDDATRASLDLLDAIAARAVDLRTAITSGCTTMSTDRYGPNPAC